MKIVWDELEFNCPTPNCSCVVACTCALRDSVQSYKDKEHVICFLKGLNDSYQAVRTQILMMNPLSSISQAYSLVIQQERHYSFSSFADSSAFSFNSNNAIFQNRLNNPSQGRGRGRGRGRTPNTKSMLCTYCNKTNHTIESFQGHRYFLTIVDDYTRHTWLYLMHNKTETRSHIVTFLNLVKTQFSTHVKIIRSDNGLEFNMPSFYASLGILHQKSCVETPQ